MRNINVHYDHLKWLVQTKSPLWVILLVMAWLCTFGSNQVNAAPLPANLIISTNPSTVSGVSNGLSFDETASVSTTGNGTHTGTITQTIGGTSSMTTIGGANGITITAGTNPLTGSLIDIGDGWEIHSDITGNSSGATSPDYFYDLFFSLQNQSATDNIQVTLSLNFDNHVDSSATDAFAASEIILFDGSNTELFFSDIESDTVSGNRFNSAARTGDFGGALDDNGTFQKNIVLNPGDLLNFHIFHKIRGGAFTSNANYAASLDALVSFDARNLTTPPPPVPITEPDILALLSTGLLAVLFRRKIRF
ncbi:PEP-CTERM protein-sorting domain-containing protein [Nitrosomonas aestuarii]|uniref:PEP-CTERM protein-sorting domain-containing protein n=1 Tax=Nitrosomonas aestuarii TaxID=52441 RepID=A0A1I4DTH8_9PROT|nr:hypothetical protein [Nitrosomonas aestuarii]SFK95231.1 PEP-CTERM protein-sorting domain-containing protein [Nitrosomonas aestuarii]